MAPTQTPISAAPAHRSQIAEKRVSRPGNPFDNVVLSAVQQSTPSGDDYLVPAENETIDTVDDVFYNYVERYSDLSPTEKTLQIVHITQQYGAPTDYMTEELGGASPLTEVVDRMWTDCIVAVGKRLTREMHGLTTSADREEDFDDCTYRADPGGIYIDPLQLVDDLVAASESAESPRLAAGQAIDDNREWTRMLTPVETVHLVTTLRDSNLDVRDHLHSDQLPGVTAVWEAVIFSGVGYFTLEDAVATALEL